MITPQQFETLLPLAVQWAGEQEDIILRDGTPLSERQLADAASLGVKHPEKVRLLRVASVPIPEHPALSAVAAASGLISSFTSGMTLRYGIFIREDWWDDRQLVAHELVHTSQYERLGGFAAFLRPYLQECIAPPGYPHGPLETEAADRSAQLCIAD